MERNSQIVFVLTRKAISKAVLWRLKKKRSQSGYAGQ